jgi:sugar lactone lactonase YvrE
VPELQTLMTGLVFGEPPRWYDNRLYCFDIATHEVFRIDLAGNADVITREPAGIASIGFLDGALLVARRDGLIQRRQADGSFITHAELAPLSDKPWNDMVVDGRGNTTSAISASIFRAENSGQVLSRG